MRAVRRLGWLAIPLAAWLAGCSSSADEGADDSTPQDDAGSAAADAATPEGGVGNEAGSDASVAPAFAPEMPQIMNQGGALLATPTVVTVTWSSDPNRATYEAFGDAIGASTAMPISRTAPQMPTALAPRTSYAQTVTAVAYAQSPMTEPAKASSMRRWAKCASISPARSHRPRPQLNYKALRRRARLRPRGLMPAKQGVRSTRPAL